MPTTPPVAGPAPQVLMYIPEQVYGVNLVLYGLANGAVSSELYIALRVRRRTVAAAARRGTSAARCLQRPECSWQWHQLGATGAQRTAWGERSARGGRSSPLGRGLEGRGCVAVASVRGSGVGGAQVCNGNVMHADFSNDSSLFITAGRDNLIHVWESDTGVPRTTLAGHSSDVMFCKISEDGVAGGAGRPAPRARWTVHVVLGHPRCQCADVHIT
jgi:hypothetical protein